MSLKMELLFLVSLMIIGLNLNSTNGCFEMERRALLTFKTGINDPDNLLTSWHGQDCCNWSGVACETKTGHVMRLNLGYSDFYLRGNINPSLRHLRHLTHLDLSGNDFSQISVPEFIGSFENLIYLDLSGSLFRGVIPYQLGNLSKLRHLDLGDSNFRGTIPTQLGNLSNLQHLSLNDAYGFYGFSVGPVSWISRLSSLKYLDMRGTNLSEVVVWSEVNKMLSLTTLILSNCNLLNIPPIFSQVNFTSLQKLDLSNNLFNTMLPSWFGNLTNILYLDLSRSYFYGRIPDALGTLALLNYLDLSWNNIDTTFLEPVRKLHNLMGINLNNMEIGGDVFDLIRRLSCRWYDLEIVGLGGNNLHGNISNWITQMKNLSALDLSNNLLSGPITHAIGILNNLTVLDLSNNSLSGVIKEVHFTKLSQLTRLSLSDNLLAVDVNDNWIPPFQLGVIRLNSCKLGPRFPRWLRWQTQLSTLELSKNSIVDTIPIWLWNLSLMNLDLSYNNIKGNLPVSFNSNIASLSLRSNNLEGPLPNFSSWLLMLDLSNNGISGPFPTKLYLPYMFFLRLSGNRISGTIPSYICDMPYLQYLSLSNNILSGEIPSCQNRTNLIMLDLSNNNLTGVLPPSLGLFANLKTLQLDNNMLRGEIPLAFKKCKNLVFLGLGRNKLSGKIPAWIGTNLKNLVIVQLRSNMFSGFIPRELGQLANLHILDLSHNYLAGSIPSSFGNFSAMRNISQNFHSEFYSSIFVMFRINNGGALIDLFTNIKGENIYSSKPLDQVMSIDLSGNNLSGHIPKEIGSLIFLINLNLSLNHLIGKIPDTIGSITTLECLDLSINELSGHIPRYFSSLTMLNHLNLSYNNLSGKIPYARQLDTLNDPSMYIGNAYLCGPPTIKQCPGDGETTLNIGVDEKRIEMLWLYYSVGGGFIFGWWCVCGVLLFCGVWRIAYFQMVDKLFDNMLVKFVLTMRRLKHVFGK